MIIESRPGNEQYLKGLSFTVPDYLSDTNLNFYYEITDDKGGEIDVSQTLRINSFNDEPEPISNRSPQLTGQQALDTPNAPCELRKMGIRHIRVLVP